MTREEREAFVRRTCAWFGKGVAEAAIAKIVDKWESEIDEIHAKALAERLGGD